MRNRNAGERGGIAGGETLIGGRRGGQRAGSVHADETVVLTVQGGDAVQGALPLPSLFTLGGPFSFPGYSIDELTGDTYLAARVMYRRKLTNRAESLFGLPLYAGATVVTGNTWTARGVDLSNLRVGANLYIAADTYFGPVFLAVGAADRGRSAFYLFVGKPF